MAIKSKTSKMLVIPGTNIDNKHYSTSAISEYTSCPLRYKFNRIDHFPGKPTGPDLFFGDAYHCALEDFHKNIINNIPPSLNFLIDSFKKHWKTVNENQKKPNPKNKTIHPIPYKMEMHKSGYMQSESGFEKLGIEMLTSYYNQNIHTEWFNTPICTEAGFYVPLIDPITGEILSNEICSMGYIDLIIKTKEHGIVILDHKTAGAQYSEQKIESDMQLTLYAYAFTLIQKCPDLLKQFNLNILPDEKISVCFSLHLKTKGRLQNEGNIKYITVRTQPDMRRMINIISNSHKGIINNIFFPTSDTMLCGYCDFLEYCKKWGTYQEPEKFEKNNNFTDDNDKLIDEW